MDDFAASCHFSYSNTGIDRPPVLPALPGTFSQHRPIYQDVARRVLSNARVFDEMPHHCNALEPLRYLRQKGEMQKRKNIVLLNVDAHSDIQLKKDVRQLEHLDIGSWVGRALMENPEITDFIWYCPPEIAASAKKHGSEKTKDVFLQEENQFQLYIHQQTLKISTNKPPRHQLDQYRVVNCQRVTTLPNLDKRNVIYSQDMDYFNNSGHDTAGDTVVPYRGERHVQQLFNALDRAKARPFVVMTCISPYYVPIQDELTMRQVSGHIGQFSQRNDLMAAYEYPNSQGKSATYYGIPRLRSSKVEYQLQRELALLDQATTHTDGLIATTIPPAHNPEYEAAIQKTMAIGSLDRRLAIAKLQGLCTRNGVIDLLQWEANIQKQNTVGRFLG